MSDRAKKCGKLALQLLVSVTLVALVLREIDVAQVQSLTMRQNEWPWLLGALVLFNFSKITSALRLNVYQQQANILLSEKENLKLYYAGMFLNQFLPGGIGGDGYKILVLHRHQAAPVKTLVTITLADRISGLLILLLLLSLLLPMLPMPWPAGWIRAAALTSILAIIATFVVGHRLTLRMKNGRRMAALFGYGMIVQLLQLACMALLLAWLQAPAEHAVAYLAVFLISSVASVVPISFGGLGAREITFVYCLSLMHLDPIHGVIASSAFFLITLLSSLVGMIFLGRFSFKSSSKYANSKVVQ